jgi:acyl dehydratase
MLCASVTIRSTARVPVLVKPLIFPGEQMTQQKIDYKILTTDYEFKPANFQLSSESVTAYLDAVESNKSIYERYKIVPPMAIAALAMTEMAAGISMPPGAVHVSQDLQFFSLVGYDEILTSYARVNRKVERGKIHMLTIGIKVMDQKQQIVLSGETSFILPLS